MMKHDGQERLQDAIRTLTSPTALVAEGLIRQIGTKNLSKQNLLDAYLGGDVSRIAADALARPTHYTDEQKDLIKKIQNGEAVSDRDKSSLLLQWTHPTEPARQEQRMKKPKDEDEEDEDLEDITPVVEETPKPEDTASEVPKPEDTGEKEEEAEEPEEDFLDIL